MKISIKIAATLCLSTVLLSKPLFAGEAKPLKEEVLIAQDTKWWAASLSTGWDSLYMFRGVNVLRGDQRYGSSLYWTDLNATWNITDNDFLTIGSWMAFGLDSTNYKELDLYAGYTHTIGNLALSFGYIFYDVISGPFYSNELNWKAAYTVELPAGITITPSLTYYLNVGPDVADGEGIVKTAAGFLQARIDAGIPIYKDIVSLTPWVGLGASFDYNLKQNGEYLTGLNNLEIGIGVPIKVNDTITLYGYAAYSSQWHDLVGTEPNTFWGGAKVSFAF